jgi:hypothetical protein
VVVRSNNNSGKGSKKQVDKDTRVMNSLRESKTNPIGYLDKLRCEDCGRSVPDNRYKGYCQNCYFNRNDVTLMKYP